jgi:iron(III) transport system ATP-binding protein
MKNGILQQIDAPEIIYKYPANDFVANFIGTSNFIDSKVIRSNGKTYLNISNIQIPVTLRVDYNGETKTSLRPEHIYLTEDEDNTLKGEIQLTTFLGDFTNYEILLENGQVIEANEYTKDVASFRKAGDIVRIKIHPDKINLFDSEGKVAIL